MASSSSSSSFTQQVLSYTDLSDVWQETGLGASSNLLNLQQVAISSSKSSAKSSQRLLKNVQARLVQSSALERLCVQYKDSPASWFRCPFAELVCWRSEDWASYKRNFRLQLRAMAHERKRTDPVPIFVLVTKGPLDKSMKAVLDAVQGELSPRAVVHLSQGGTVGMQDLLSAVKSALAQSLEGRVGAYRAEVQRILGKDIGEEGDPEAVVDLGALYVVKDSLAALLESVGMYQEACNEYSELEAMIEECVAGGCGEGREGGEAGQAAASWGRCNTTECSVSQVVGVDECRQLWHSWGGTRRAVAATSGDGDMTRTRTYIDFVLIPSIVCNMVRLLMKDSGKKIEALRVCRTFISNHRAVIARYERQNKCPAGMEAAWTFAACVSSVIRVCLDVDDAERLEDVGLLARLRDLVSDDGSDIAKLNAKFHRAVGQLLLEARDALTLDDANVACVTDASEPAAILDEMLRVPASTFAARKPASSLTPQNSLSTPRASAMASMASAFTHHDTSKSLENVDLDGVYDGDDGDDVSELPPAMSSQHNRSISLHNPVALDSAMSSGSSGNAAIMSMVTSTLATANAEVPGTTSLLDVEASIDGHAAPLFVLLGREDDRIDTRWIPTYPPLVSAIDIGGSSSSRGSSPSKKTTMVITEAAKSFFERGGYFRNAAVLSIQLGDDAFKRKDFGTSTGIFMDVAEMLEAENWAGVYEDVLLKLARSQVCDGDRGIVGTCHRLVRLKCDSTYASMLVRATELSGGMPSFGVGAFDADVVLSMDPCLRLVSGGRAGARVGGRTRQTRHFVGDTVRVPVTIVNDTGIEISLDGVKVVFEADGEENGGDDSEGERTVDGFRLGTASVQSPHLQHLQHAAIIHQSSPRFGNQSPTSLFGGAAIKRDAVQRPPPLPVLEGVPEASHVVVPPAHQPSTTIDIYVNPIVPGTYVLTKLLASINGVCVEITPADWMVVSIEPPEPRIRVDAITHRLIAGEDQWLGVEVDVLREEDADPPHTMNVEWPVGPSTIRPESTPAVATINGTCVDPDSSFNLPNTLQYTNCSTIAMPWTVWWRVHAEKTPDVPAEDVRVSVSSAPLLTSGDGGASKVKPSASVAPTISNSIPNSMLNTIQLPVSLLFEGGRQRWRKNRVASAAAVAAVDQPFLVRTEAREITKGVILMSMQITSSADRTVVIEDVDLQCQQGFSVSSPARAEREREREPPKQRQNWKLPPLASMCASFVLKLDQSLLENRAVAQATVYRTGKQAPSVALISYTVVPGNETTPGMPGYAAPQIAEVAQSSQSYVHQHPIALQLSSIATDASAKNEFVSLRMLGPFTAIIGCPVTLCWQLERVGGSVDRDGGDGDEDDGDGGGEQEATGISYEVRADASVWSRGSRAQGIVSLGHRNGSVATVEMAWTPTTIGSLAMPTLRLHDVYYQDATRGKNVIHVKM